MNKMIKMFLASVMLSASTAMAAEIKVDQDTDTSGAPDLSVHFQLELDNAMIFKIVHKEMKDSFLADAVAPMAGDQEGFIHLGKIKKVAPAAAGANCAADLMMDYGDGQAVAFNMAKLQPLAGTETVDADTQVDLSTEVTNLNTAACQVTTDQGSKFIELEIPLVALYAVSGSPATVSISMENGTLDGADVINTFDSISLRDPQGSVSTAGTGTSGNLSGNGIMKSAAILKAKISGAGVKQQYNATVHYDVSQL